MIHLLNFRSEIIDFISEKDGALFEAKHNRQAKDKKETFDFSILSSRAEKFRERNRVITQDSNGNYREFIITGISDDMDGVTEIQTNASYLEDIGTAKPFVPGELKDMTATQALYEVLRDTGWEVAPDTEYNGIKTTKWTEHKAPYDVGLQLETTYDMELDFYIELGSNEVEHRYAVLRHPKSLFKGKEVNFGKDLTGLSREVDFTEIKTALMVVGPEDDDGNTKEVVVTDDLAQRQFGLPQRYIWDVYKPESQDKDITESKLKALGENELDKIKTASVTYEISSLDIDYLYQHETTSIGDTIRVKDEDFNPPLYLEAEVIGEEYDLLGKESVYTFGKVIRYSEEDLTQFFRQRLQEIRKKLNDDITNLNTQLQETVENSDKYYEQKIIKQPEPPENPVENMLWYDTSNPDVAVLRRYRNGEWHNQTASDVQQLGGMTREETIYNELTSTFEDLQLQHSMLQSDVYDVINSQYLVDTQLKEQVQSDLDNVSVTFNQIKTNLDSMDKDTATIGKLIDTQAMFQDYRENLQKLNNSVQNAKISIDERLKLLQQQYTKDKFNDAMTEVANTLPNGEWDGETGRLLADIPNQEQLADLKTTVNDYVDGEIQTLNDNLVEKINTDITNTKKELSASVSSVEEKVDGLEVGARNLLVSFAEQYNGMVKTYIESTQSFEFSGWGANLYSSEYINQKLKPEEAYTISYDVEVIKLTDVAEQLEPTMLSTGLILFDRTTNDYLMRSRKEMPREIGYTEHISETFEMKTGDYDLIGYSNLFRGNVIVDDTTDNDTSDTTESTQTNTKEKNTTTDTNTTETTIDDTTSTQEPTDDTTTNDTKTDTTQTVEVSESDTIRITNLKLEKGTVATDYTPAPEDFQNDISSIGATVEEQSTEISLMKDNINLKADKTTVSQQLGEVESRVEDNTAQLNIQSDEINSKVSTSDYTADQENVVNRLDSAETERQQLSDEINDRVTLTEYQNLNIGTRNLMLNTNERDDFIGVEDTELHIEYEFARPLTVGDEYTLSYEIYDLSGEPINRVSYYPYDPAGERRDISVVNNKVIATFTAQAKSEKMHLYKGLAAMTDPTKDFVIKNAMLVEGNKAGDYAEAPEQSDTRLNEMETSIKQNGEQIQDRVSLTEFNESNKTLSQVVSTLTQDTTNGLTYTFDENGKITSFNVGNDGVTIRGDSVDITVNDDFKVVAQDLNNKVDQDNIINRLNLSPEGLDINVNNLGIQGGDGSKNYVDIRNDRIELGGEVTRTWRGETGTDNIYTSLSDGYLRFRNEDTNSSLYMSQFGMSTFKDQNGDYVDSPGASSGTIAWWDGSFSPSGAHGITINSYGGVASLTSGLNMTLVKSHASVNLESSRSPIYFRPKMKELGNSAFEFTLSDDNPSEYAVKGYLMFGNFPTATAGGTDSYSGGLRFYKHKPYVEVVDDTFSAGGATALDAGNILTNNIFKRTGSTTAYWNGTSSGTINDGPLPIDNQLVATSMVTNRGDHNMYLGPRSNGSLLITDEHGYNNGDGQSYSGVGAKRFTPMSTERIKTDIEPFTRDALQLLVDEVEIMQYKYINDVETGYGILSRGLVVGEEYKTPPELVDGEGINLYEMASWTVRALQQLNTKVEILKETTEKQDERIKKLEELINAK